MGVYSESYTRDQAEDRISWGEDQISSHPRTFEGRLGWHSFIKSVGRQAAMVMAILQ